MKISDFLKKLGIAVDEDIEGVDDTEKTSDTANEKIDDTVEKSEDTVSPTFEDVNKNDKIIIGEEELKLDVKYDSKTGLFDTRGIKDETLKNILKQSNEFVTNQATRYSKEIAVHKSLSSINMIDGAQDLIFKLGDFDKITFGEDGVADTTAFVEDLKTQYSCLFKQDKPVEKASDVEHSNTSSTSPVVSNPLFEGFNPQHTLNEIDSNSIPRSFLEAFQQNN